MSADLYDIVGDRIREFCDKTYYGDIIISFEQSYDGKEWTKEVEFATFYNGTNLCYENDWNEGQTFLRNLRIWHLEDSEPVKHGRWIDVYDNNGHHQVCSECGEWRYHNKQIYCGFCGVRMDGTNESVDLGNGFSISVNESQFNPQGRDCLECLYSPTCYGAGIGKPACKAFVPRVRYVDVGKEVEE